MAGQFAGYDTYEEMQAELDKQARITEMKRRSAEEKQWTESQTAQETNAAVVAAEAEKKRLADNAAIVAKNDAFLSQNDALVKEMMRQESLKNSVPVNLTPATNPTLDQMLADIIAKKNATQTTTPTTTTATPMATTTTPTTVSTTAPAVGTPTTAIPTATTPEKTALEKLLEEQVAGYLKPQDMTARRETEAAQIKAETEAALNERMLVIKNLASQRHGLDSGGYLGESGQAVLEAQLAEKQRLAESEKTISAEQLAREQFGISSGLSLAGQQAQKAEAEINRKFATAERLSTQEFQGLTQEKQNKYTAEQADIQRVFQRGERTESEANEAAQNVLKMAWTSGENKAAAANQMILTQYTTEANKAMEQAKLAQNQGQFDVQMQWEKYATDLNNNLKVTMQNKQIEADTNARNAEIQYRRTLDGYFENGVYTPGITAINQQIQNAFNANQTKLERDLRIKLAEMQNEAEKWKTIYTENSSESNGYGQFMGELAKIGIGVLI